MDRRTGKDLEKLQRRRETAAKKRNPNRWPKDIRKWESPGSVYLNLIKKFTTKEKMLHDYCIFSMRK